MKRAIPKMGIRKKEGAQVRGKPNAYINPASRHNKIDFTMRILFSLLKIANHVA